LGMAKEGDEDKIGNYVPKALMTLAFAAKVN
jgi:hypothetical protein